MGLSADRPYKCPSCDKAFRRREHVIRHMTTHARGRLFECPHQSCSKRFYRADELTRHQQRIHGNPRSGEVSKEQGVVPTAATVVLPVRSSAQNARPTHEHARNRKSHVAIAPRKAGDGTTRNVIKSAETIPQVASAQQERPPQKIDAESLSSKREQKQQRLDVLPHLSRTARVLYKVVTDLIEKKKTNIKRWPAGMILGYPTHIVEMKQLTGAPLHELVHTCLELCEIGLMAKTLSQAGWYHTIPMREWAKQHPVGIEAARARVEQLRLNKELS
ncbi:hypothetical protein LTR17_026723 [Elasticomyces elasticus]|nr:hypothetical protein LTR17_026723 [Elasticomyces elasticus]